MHPLNDLFSKFASPHVVSYLWLRRAVGGLGLLLPLMLGPIGFFLLGIDIQQNMSCYYHTALRDVFVGILFAIGLFMFCYVGSTQFENWTGNLGCLAAIGIALCPIDYGSDPLQQRTIAGYIHTMCGGVLFTCMGLFSLWHFPASEPEDENRVWDDRRRLVFRATGIVLFCSLLVMAIYLFALDSRQREQLGRWNVIFWGEWVAIWAFAIAWLVKGRTVAGILNGVEAVKALGTPTR